MSSTHNLHKNGILLTAFVVTNYGLEGRHPCLDAEPLRSDVALGLSFVVESSKSMKRRVSSLWGGLFETNQIDYMSRRILTRDGSRVLASLC